MFIDLPTGQASWHYHDREAHLFAGLPPYTKPWDGHTTPEKYERLAALRNVRAVHTPPAAEIRYPRQLPPEMFRRGECPVPDAKIIDFAEALERDAERKPGWQTWWMTCLDCGHHVVSVCHEESKGFFQCGNCRKMRMVRTAPATE